jgi:hypothetical protein
MRIAYAPGITKNRPGNNRAKSPGYEGYEKSPLDNARIAEQMADGAAAAAREQLAPLQRPAVSR